MLEDLDRRARPGRPSRNRPLQRYVSAADTVVFSSDVVTTEVLENPQQWQTASASSFRLIWSAGSWR